MKVVKFPEPKDMRENIEMLAECQLKTNDALASMAPFIKSLGEWTKMQEEINRENERKIEMLMKAMKFTS